jgi:hypothetical protein
MTLHLPRLPITVDPLIAEAKRRMRRRRSLAVLLLAAVGLAVGLTLALRPGGPEAPRGGPGTFAQHSSVTGAGQIGPLEIGRSTRAEVIAFAGKPTSELRGSLAASIPRVDALFYGCHVIRSVDQNYACRTIFWIGARTGRLVAFWTRDPRYTTIGGVHVGTPTRAAERAIHKTAGAGCGTGFRLGSKRAAFAIYISGSHLGPKARVIGGRVSLLVLTGLPDVYQVTNC